jgi:hypothetical protein
VVDGIVTTVTVDGIKIPGTITGDVGKTDTGGKIVYGIVRVGTLGTHVHHPGVDGSGKHLHDGGATAVGSGETVLGKTSTTTGGNSVNGK